MSKNDSGYDYLKGNLQSVKEHLFVNKDDPTYYEKIIQHVNPQSAEAHFELASRFKAADNLDKAIYHFKEATKSDSPYYIKAKNEIAEIERTLLKQTYIKSGTKKQNQSSIWRNLFTIACLLCLAISGLLIYKITKADSLEASAPVNQMDVASQEHKGSTTNEGEELPAVTKAQVVNEPLLQVGANVVRTALKSYIAEFGGPPEKINQLFQDYPNNYISAIPNEVITGSSAVSEEYDGKGGWVFNPEAYDIESMFFPNVGCPNCIDPGNDLEKSGKELEKFPSVTPYEPIEIVVSKESHQLRLMSGENIIAVKDVGIGKDNRTPEGTLTISDRVLSPKGKSPNVYGVAGLGMGEFALHGTYDEDSISKNESLGCIRLSNKDIMDIYHLVPLGTTVHIQNAKFEDGPESLTPNSLVPLNTNDEKQKAEGKIFNWFQ
ncbi:L,D-transpeptidase [Niallia taxi]|uniref:L,D-transpeptidase n=1 Tax=Niallia taxi TaxID=2499688 RepID=UPI0015F3EE22|nr:L,D-transpeptidase [Niallia taxi]